VPPTPAGPPQALSAPRPLFRDEPRPAGLAAPIRPAMPIGIRPVSEPDEFENFRPGNDFPPPVFPQTPPDEPIDRGRIVGYALAAVVFAAGCVLVYAVNHKHSDNAATSSPPKGSANPPAGSSPTPSQGSVGVGAIPAPTVTASSGAPSSNISTSSRPPASGSTPGSAPRDTPAQNPETTTPPAPGANQPADNGGGGGGGVKSLSISSFAPDQTGSFTYVAHVHVTTRGTGSVTVTITFAGTDSSASPGSAGARSKSFTLSGNTAYDIEWESDVNSMCPSPYIDVVASGSGASSAAQYASSPC